MEVNITSKYIPDYGASEIWDSIDNFVIFIEKIINKRLYNIKLEYISDTKIIDNIKTVLDNSKPFKKLYPNLTLIKVEQILDTTNSDILKVLPYLLTAYTYNFSMNKVLKKHINNKYKNDDSWNGFRALFDSTYSIPDDSKTNYKDLKRYYAHRFIIDKFIQHDSNKLSEYDNELQTSMQWDKTFYEKLKILYIFSKYVQLTEMINGVDIIFSSYILQYQTLAFSVLQSIPDELWDKDDLDTLFCYDSSDINNTKKAIYRTLCQLGNIIINEDDIIRKDNTYLLMVINDLIEQRRLEIDMNNMSYTTNTMLLDIINHINGEADK